MVTFLYMAEAGLLAGLELVIRLVLVLVHVLQEVRSQGRREWMRKIGVDHNSLRLCPTHLSWTLLFANPCAWSQQCRGGVMKPSCDLAPGDLVGLG